MKTRTIAGSFASAARGGDILFHEECRKRGIETTIVLPFQPDDFVKMSVESSDGEDWPRRFRALWDETAADARVILGLPITDRAFAACNAAAGAGGKKGHIHLIALWDGRGGDGPGGTADMVKQAMESGDQPAPSHRRT